jgi:hypothetical protein
MDQKHLENRKLFDDAIALAGIRKESGDKIWQQITSLGITVDEFIVSVMVILAEMRETVDGVGNVLKAFENRFAGHLDSAKSAADKEIAASIAKAVAAIGEDIAKAVEAAVANIVETDRQASVTRERRTTITAATLCICGVLAVGGLAYATGYVSGRDNAIITASRFEALAKDPAAGLVLNVVELNGPDVFDSYCGRGSDALRSVEGRKLCAPPLWVSGPAWTATDGLKGLPWRVAATVENWAATASAWLLLLVGAAGGLMIRKGLRNFGRLGPVKWLLDIE